MLFLQFFQGKLPVRNLSPFQWLMLLQCLISLISVPTPPDPRSEFSPKVSPAESRTYNLQSTTYIPIQTWQEDKRRRIFHPHSTDRELWPKMCGSFSQVLVKQLLNHISLQELLITRIPLFRVPSKWDKKRFVRKFCVMAKEIQLSALQFWHFCSGFAECKSAVVPHLRMKQGLGKKLLGTGMRAASPEHDSDKSNWITAVTLHFLEGYIKPLFCP